MKKTLYLLLIAPLLLFSCKKEHSVPPVIHSPKLYRVAFNIANFQQQVKAFAIKQHANSLDVNSLTSPGAFLDVLYYVVFDSNQNPVKEKYQDSTMSNMGMITDSLPAGNYSITIVAGKKGLQIRTDLGPESYFYYPHNYWQDTFFGSFPLTVGTENISQDVTLNRTVGKLEVELLDNTLPATVDSLIVTVYSTNAYKSLVDGSSYNFPSATVTHSFPIPASAKSKPGFTVDMILKTSDTYITIGWKDSNNKLTVIANTGDVDIIANQTLAMSGYLIPADQAPQTFVVKADTAWNSTPNQQSFSLRRH